MKLSAYLLAFVSGVAIPVAGGAPAPLRIISAKALMESATAGVTIVERDCLVAATLTYNMFFGFFESRSKPEEMLAFLKDNPVDAGLSELRQQYVAVWGQKRNPAEIAVLRLDNCLGEHGMRLQSRDIPRICFSNSAPSAHAISRKHLGWTQEQTLADSLKIFGSQVDEKLLRLAIRAVYESPDYQSQVAFETGAFMGCLSRATQAK